MITIGDILRPKRINLNLKATAPEEAIYEVASLLKDDERVNDWNGLYDGLISRKPGMAGDGDFEICIPHTRTNAVSTMVMSVGRSEAGIVFPKSKRKTHYIFVIGVPLALAADYLRIIGALARIFANTTAESALRKTPAAEDFLAVLTDYEMKL